MKNILTQHVPPRKMGSKHHASSMNYKLCSMLKEKVDCIPKLKGVELVWIS